MTPATTMQPARVAGFFVPEGGHVSKMIRDGAVFISDRLFAHPEAVELPPSAFAGWVRAVCWASKYMRGHDWLIPHTATRMFFSKRDIANLLAIEWLVAVEGGYRPPMQDARGRDLWRPGPRPAAEIRRRKIPAALRSWIYARDGHACVTCGSAESLTLDHIKPFSLGGSDEPDNLQTMCLSCNSRKGARV